MRIGNASLVDSVSVVLLEKIRFQVFAFLGDVLSDRREICYRRSDDSHGFAYDLGVDFVVALSHFADQIHHRERRKNSLTVERHDEASVTVQVDDSSLVLQF